MLTELEMSVVFSVEFRLSSSRSMTPPSTRLVELMSVGSREKSLASFVRVKMSAVTVTAEVSLSRKEARGPLAKMSSA